MLSSADRQITQSALGILFSAIAQLPTLDQRKAILDHLSKITPVPVGYEPVDIIKFATHFAEQSFAITRQLQAEAIEATAEAAKCRCAGERLDGYTRGVISGSRARHLLAQIQDNGTNLTYDAFTSEIKRQLQGRLGDLEFSQTPDLEARTNEFKRAVRDSVGQFVSDADAAEYAVRASELFDAASGTFSIDEVEKLVFEFLAQDDVYQGNEECHELIGDDFHYKTSWLGGAILIDVLRSPWVAACTFCSPCVPNTGDLDSPRSEDTYNVLAYCVDPSCIDKELVGDYLFMRLDEIDPVSGEPVVWLRPYAEFPK